MSQKNVEVVRRYLEEGLEAVPAERLSAWIARFWEADGDYYPVRGFPEVRPCHGREEIEDFFAGLRDPWNYRVVVNGVRTIGDDRVLAQTHGWAEGLRAARSSRGRSTPASGCGIDDSFAWRIT